jgi:hypothetical protein
MRFNRWKETQMMLQTICLEPKVPNHLRGGYTGRSFRAGVTERVEIPSTAGLWEGGSRDTYSLIRLADGASLSATPSGDPWNRSGGTIVLLEPGIAVAKRTTFAGKDHGITFYVHPANAAAMLPAPAPEMGPVERLVLAYICTRKSSYAGRNRFQQAAGDIRDGWPERAAGWPRDSRRPPNAGEWEEAKQMLVEKGFLTKVGAVTPAGRNALSAVAAS